MDSRSLYYFLLALVPVLYLTKSFIASIGSRHRGLRLPPGPWKLPIIGSLHHLLRTPAHRALRDLSRRHGPVMSLKFGELPVVVVSSREAAEEVMKTHDAVLASRPQTATVRFVTSQGPIIAVGRYGDHWRQARKICVHELLNANRIRSFRSIREEEAMRLVQAISSAAAPRVNLFMVLGTHVNDVAMRCIIGDRFDDQDTFLRNVDEAIRLAGTFRLADLFPSSRLACALSQTMRRAEVCMENVFKIMDCIISQHLERRSMYKEEHQEYLIDVLLRIQREGNLQVPITMGTVKGILFELLSGGSETAPTVLHWAMAELIRNPAVMSRAQSEVRGAFMGQMKVTEEGLSKLSYLHWVIKETLRLHTPTPLALPRESQEACRVMGYDIPKGTMVLVNAWAIARDPKYWDEPEIFNPERFETDTRDFKGRDFEFTPFGAGRRICPGMLFGLSNVEMALAHLLFYFDWNLSEDIHVGELDMTETTGIIARRKADLWLEPTLHVPFVSMN